MYQAADNLHARLIHELSKHVELLELVEAAQAAGRVTVVVVVLCTVRWTPGGCGGAMYCMLITVVVVWHAQYVGTQCGCQADQAAAAFNSCSSGLCLSSPGGSPLPACQLLAVTCSQWSVMHEASRAGRGNPGHC